MQSTVDQFITKQNETINSKFESYSEQKAIGGGFTLTTYVDTITINMMKSLESVSSLL
jgi:hypothetical protein